MENLKKRRWRRLGAGSLQGVAATAVNGILGGLDADRP